MLQKPRDDRHNPYRDEEFLAQSTVEAHPGEK